MARPGIVGNASKSEAIRDAIRSYADQLKRLEVVRIRDLPKSQARKEVLEFSPPASSDEEHEHNT
jgi:Arc/MetJ-type ribon-helix-helix transcriptional regulator